MSMIPAYLERTFNADLIRSSLALSLDRSESVAISYALGQAMTSIFCREQLGVTHLLHVDRYAPQYHLRFGGTRRADLFGPSPNGWVVAEAKGRSGSVPLELRRTLVAQKRSVSEIEGKPPWVAVGCVAYFPQRNGAMQVDAFDPVKDIDEPSFFDVERDDYLLSYYRPFLRVLESGEREERGAFEAVEFPDFGVRVGVPARLVERLRRAESEEVDGLADDVSGILDDVHSREIGVLPDGCVIETDWQGPAGLDGGPLFD
ncbi:hypothetical protein CFP71_06785 [Amycolatopsis thailandensis]|uniref:Restriction endonuclease n=1 Tax=Amycolatopsis thailandensis TaxID=589330 RepID=A0A229SFS2_9PSEU|nr:hypothetical protein CFP71_06785 [Amycolatopsis thailandensis]